MTSKVAEPPDTLAPLAARFLEAQLAGDQWEAFRVASGAVAAGHPLRDVQARVIRAAQEQIGVLWQANRITIAQEHLATGIAQVVLARLTDHAEATPRNGRTVCVACVEGEHHDLPARLVGDYLSQDGFAVRFLGANVPTESLVAMLADIAPDLLALSITMTFHVPALRSAIPQIRSTFPGLPIIVGGHAIGWSPGLPAELGVRTAPRDPEALVAVVRELTGVRP